MNYITLDLEWNQGDGHRDPINNEIPFEVIDVGAVKLDANRYIQDEFDQLVKPQVYKHLHYMTRKIIHMQMSDLKKGKVFPLVMKEFLDWCGEDYVFCTWSPSDLGELQRNMSYYCMKPLDNKPIRFLDVQKLFSIAYEDTKNRRSLESAIDLLKLEKDVPFHRAFSDAYYTARVLSVLPEGVLGYYSYDTYNLPLSRGSEIHADFESYHKYISIEFPDKEAVLADREAMSTRCYLCGGKRNLKRVIKWFTFNGKQYHCVSQCATHGYMKFKLRLKKRGEESVYVVKTSKVIDQEAYLEVLARKKAAQGKSKEKEARKEERRKEERRKLKDAEG